MFIPALKANWQVWPVIQLVNFRFMPLAYRVPFQATCGVFWTLYLSLLNARYIHLSTMKTFFLMTVASDREDIKLDGQIGAKAGQL